MNDDLSLTRAKAKFFEATADERMVQREHKKLLSAYLDECIEHRKKEAIYTVPEIITGSFPLYDVHEVGLWLLRQCRRGGLEAQLVSPDPFTMRVSGWAEKDWLEKDSPEAPVERSKPSKSTGKQKGAVRAQAIDVASASAQRGELTARLRQLAEKYQ